MKKVTKVFISTGALVGFSLLGNSEDVSASTWTPNTVDQIMTQMQEQKDEKQVLAVYEVQSGDTLSGIAEACDLTLDQILAMNDIPNPDLIHVGQLINLGYSEKANNFVAEKGQSVANNAKSYQVPTSNSAKQAMIETKDWTP